MYRTALLVILIAAVIVVIIAAAWYYYSQGSEREGMTAADLEKQLAALHKEAAAAEAAVEQARNDMAAAQNDVDRVAAEQRVMEQEAAARRAAHEAALLAATTPRWRTFNNLHVISGAVKRGSSWPIKFGGTASSAAACQAMCDAAREHGQPCAAYTWHTPGTSEWARECYLVANIGSIQRVQDITGGHHVTGVYY